MNRLPRGLYDRLLDAAGAAAIDESVGADHAWIEDLTDSERRRRLVEELAKVLPDLLDQVSAADDSNVIREQREIAVVLELLAVLRQAGASADAMPQWTPPMRTLRAVHPDGPRPSYPDTGVRVPWLFTAGRADPSLLNELRAEIAGADRVDMLVSFITWSGVRKLWDVLQSATATDAGGRTRTRFRILTTTYTGATEARAVDALASLPGVDVRISLDGRRSRLHAKAWLFHRDTGFGTGYVGSANLSGAALAAGIEWTVKLTQAGQPDLFAAADAHFETLWNDPEFQPFEHGNAEHLATLRKALKEESGGNVVAMPTWFDIQPRQFQQEMLDRLAAERRHGRMRNLLVAATGTGKTMVAAFDYQRIRQEQGGGLPRLLFVAHRRQILEQALATFRQVLRISDFGELLAEGNEPASHDHLFATIQSVVSRRLVEQRGAEHWHCVVIDECHHLPADSFDRFARAIKPAVLLGLTATPERADGRQLADYFDQRADGSPAVSLRIWDALDQQLVAPFEYYASADDTDLSKVRWHRGDGREDLDNVLSGDDVRARAVINAIDHYLPRRDDMKALAFCVSVRHAEFMARKFTEAGIPAVALSGDSTNEQRRDAPRDLASGRIRVVCTCDLYNEGVDLPEVNTLLFLRPTQSAVLFQQQLGRGLRLVAGKDACIVLDFVGLYRDDFRFDHLFQSVTGLSRKDLDHEVEHGFSRLPAGCHIQFDRVAKERVLQSLRAISRQTWKRLAAELAAYAMQRGSTDAPLAAFLRDQRIALDDVYRSKGHWSALKRAAGLPALPEGPDEAYLGGNLRTLLHANDSARLVTWGALAKAPFDAPSNPDVRTRRIAQMLAYQLYADRKHVMDDAAFLQRLQGHPALCVELGELAAHLDELSDLEGHALPGCPADWPLTLHGCYEIREILTAVGWLRGDRRSPFQAGVLAIADEKIELMFVTLDKREGYHERIAYHDYAISPSRFHWQTQNAAGPDTMSGRRYLESDHNGWTFQLFVRESREHPYCALGPVVLESAEGDRPMSIVWSLQVPLPVEMFRRFSVLRGG
jgi:superfamily II DNA or RNA helicase